MRDLGVIDRWGAALVAPRAALAAADRPDAAGRAVSDGGLALLLAFIACHATTLVQCGWDLADRELGLALRGLVAALAGFAAPFVIAIFAVGALGFVLAGPRRSFGRDLDLAAVGLGPAAAVVALGHAVVRVGGLASARPHTVALVVALGWIVALVPAARGIARGREVAA